jgi:signal transduction histidine kinase/CheY-like chemotaxis protein
MATLIATELFTLLFAMDTLSAVRAFVGGEGIWSKAQKDAVLELQTYSFTHDELHYVNFRKHLLIPLGDHQARMEMQKPDMNMDIVREGFLGGQVHPHDIAPMVKLMRRFYKISYIHDAIVYWSEADDLIFTMIDKAEQLHKAILSSKQGDRSRIIRKIYAEISQVNEHLTYVENEFSSTLGEASRWLEGILMILLIIAVATVESTGLILTIAFSRGLTKALHELHSFATNVGSGDFSKTVPVRSSDELGRLADALNKMAADLRSSTNERQLADEASNIKSLFLANMSHEIRTPLNAIIGFVDILKDTNLQESERKRYLDIIERTGYSLNTIINDILDISKVEAGKLEIEKTICSLPLVLRDLQSLLSLRCEEKGIELKFLTQNIPEYIVTDVTRLKQILLNVINNAIKFTNKGCVTATFQTRDAQLLCTVEDTGIGVSAENIDKLFQPFSQVDLSIRKKFGGTGLGLILSKRLAQILGGDVVLRQSILDRGSVFEISIALGDLRGVSMPRTISEDFVNRNTKPFRGKRILIVEDSVDNQLLTEQYMLKEGAEVAIANNGLEAIELVHNGKFDLILMDMQMPVMDGYTATTKLREMGYDIPIIALTAHAMKEDLEKCLRVGCNDYLSKPFRRENLIHLIIRQWYLVKDA